MTHSGPIDGEQDIGRGTPAAAHIDRVLDWLQVGGAIVPDDYELLRDAGVTHVIDLREKPASQDDIDRLAALGIRRLHVPVADGHAPTGDQLRNVREWFAGEPEGSALYVHCQAGFGRAGTMAVGLLVDSGLPLEQAEHLVRSARPGITLNEEQRAWLKRLAG